MENTDRSDTTPQLFLTRLLVFLNAHLSRREQLISLRSAYSLSNFTSMDFRIFASESNDRIVVEWDLASPSEEDEEDEEGRTERIVVVQMAFLDLRRSLLATQRSDGMGGSLLVRYVERKPASGEFVLFGRSRCSAKKRLMLSLVPFPSHRRAPAADRARGTYGAGAQGPEGGTEHVGGHQGAGGRDDERGVVGRGGLRGGSFEHQYYFAVKLYCRDFELKGVEDP